MNERDLKQSSQRKYQDHPFDKLSDREYGLEDVGEVIRREEAKKVARLAVVPARERRHK